MAKTKTQYVCGQCGRSAPRNMGKCPQCGEWNSMSAQVISNKIDTAQSEIYGSITSKPIQLEHIDAPTTNRIPLPITEFARVLGGGIVPGSVVLVGGDPGIGKSTLMLQLATEVASQGLVVLYVSGEESTHQIKMRAVRLEDSYEDALSNLYLVTETNLHQIIEHIQTLEARLVIIDSIQTITSNDLDSGAGSVTQVRECTSQLTRISKTNDIAMFLVGHVTKEGAIAGPRVLEHTVDTVLYLEGDRHHAYRLLRGVKNRFGPTSEVGVFEMSGKGMLEVTNPSEAFLAERMARAPGSTITVAMEGTRPILVEVQALASTTAFGNPRRTPNGVDFNRLLLVTAVLARRMHMSLANQDVFVNIVGGLQIQEPAADLAIATAIASSVKDEPVPADMILLGEIGLSGELRAPGHLSARLHEATKLGFKRAIVPSSATYTDDFPVEIDVTRARDLRDALRIVLPTR